MTRTGVQDFTPGLHGGGHIKGNDIVPPGAAKASGLVP
jgi:hypothetical protein